MHDEADVASRPVSTAPKDPSRTRLPLVVYVLALGTFLMLTSEFVVAGILPEIATDLGISLAEAGSLITVFAIGMIVGAPLTTILTRRLSRRLTLILALVVFGAGHVVVALGSSIALLLAARFLTALATGAFWAVAAVVASRAGGPALASRAVGIVGAGGSLAIVLGVPLGVVIAQHVGWRGTFWALTVAAGAAVVLIARLVPGAARNEAVPLRTELASLRSRQLCLVLAACVTTCGGVIATYSFIVPILTDEAGISTSLVPLVLTGFGIGSFIGTLVGGRLGDYHPHVVTILVPAVTTVILLGIAAYADSPRMSVILVLLLGLFGFSANSVLAHLAVRYAGKAATLGSALSVASFNAGTAIGTALAGHLLTTPLGLTGPAIVGTAVVALTLVPTIALAVVSRRGPAAHSRVGP